MSGADAASAIAGFHFGDPAHPRRLRDLLEARIEAVPAGGEIAWATYYFRDRALAAALVRAHRRGVRVDVALEAHPRTPAVNRAVASLLGDEGEGIGRRLNLVRSGFFRHLHSKLYCFSHPEPAALLGSFNPSGDIPEDPAILRRIKDQDRGHNLLAELQGPIVAPLFSYARTLSTACNRPLTSGSTEVYDFPRRDNPLLPLLETLNEGSTLHAAASHVSDPTIIGAIARATRRGAMVRIIAEESRRRVPNSVERRLVATGAEVSRYRHPDGLPMHNKFLLGEGEAGRWAAFGSFNLTWTSRWLNRELLVIDRDPSLFEKFIARWQLIHGEMQAWDRRA